MSTTRSEAYVRRVPDPDPIARELARQAVDELERIEQESGGPPGRRRPAWIAALAAAFGISYGLVLDEVEARVRARG